MARGSRAERSQSTTPHVLVVDDDPLLSQALSRLLRRRGCAVSVTSTAAEAQAQVRARCYDCAILDVQLAREDGIGLACRLLSSRRVRKVVFYSGAVHGETRRRATNVGVFVDKAARFEELARAVDACIARGDGP